MGRPGTGQRIAARRWDPAGGSQAGVTLRSAFSAEPSAAAAVAAVAAELGDAAGLFLAFVTAGYDLAEAAVALTDWVGERVIACTSAGGIDSGGFRREGMVVVALSGPDVQVVTIPVLPVSDLDRAWEVADGRLRAAVDAVPHQRQSRAGFALMLVDGLSLREERVAEQVTARLDGIPLIGGSAGDDLRFRQTAVLVDGRFVQDAASVTIVTTSAAFRRFRVQHHTAGDDVLVVTAATPQLRLVHTLNGRPAVEEYARHVGIPVDHLSPVVFSMHPLVLRAGGGSWIRSISGVEPDGSLRFLCTADLGAVLRLGRAQDARLALESTFDDLRSELGEVTGALVFDCILRRLEFEETAVAGELGRLLAERSVVGFSTYGEQYDGVHVNQTMVGIAFGR